MLSVKEHSVLVIFVIRIMSEKETVNLIKLDGSNYHLWKFEVLFLLDAKELTEFINGTDKEPDKETKLND